MITSVSGMRVLLAGEGDFTFATALVKGVKYYCKEDAGFSTSDDIHNSLRLKKRRLDQLVDRTA